MTKKIIAWWTAMIARAMASVIMGFAFAIMVGKERIVKKLHARMIALGMVRVS
jgi:hypothetical protein